VGRFADAVERGDVDSVVALLTDDAWLAMPPQPHLYQGRAAIAAFLRDRATVRGTPLRVAATRGNTQPAFGCYLPVPYATIARAYGLLVLTLEGDRIAAITLVLRHRRLPPPRTTKNLARIAARRGRHDEDLGDGQQAPRPSRAWTHGWRLLAALLTPAQYRLAGGRSRRPGRRGLPDPSIRNTGGHGCAASLRHGPERRTGSRGRLSEQMGGGETAALATLREADPVIAALIDANPDYDPDAWLRRLPEMDAFGVLIFQVIGQQLSVAVTRTLLGRLMNRFGGRLPTPRELLAASPEDIRAAGLSRRKVQTLRELAERFVDGRLDPAELERLPDEEVVVRLTETPGVGRWTAEGFLAIALHRDDVVLPGDLALRKAIQRAYGLDHLPSQAEVVAIAEAWRPYRSLAVSYLFASVYGA
jgi:DNA-3-methyladenine glycosylase II